MDSLARLLRRQDGVITRWQALKYLSPKAIEHKLASRRWYRVHRALFVTRTGLLTGRQHDWAAVLLAGGDRDDSVCLAGLSALCAWGLRGIDPHGVHVLVPADGRRQAFAGVYPHRTKLTPCLDGAQHLRPMATLPGRSLVDAVSWARSDQEARLVIAASFQQGLVVLPDLERAAAEQPNARRRVLLRTTAVDCAGGSHSLAELNLLALCRRFHLPTPTRLVRCRDRQGRLRYIDALFEEWKVAVEVDGAHHLDVRQTWDDSIKANALQLDGYVVLRYPAYALREHPAKVAAELREALERAGWAPGRG